MWEASQPRFNLEHLNCKRGEDDSDQFLLLRILAPNGGYGLLKAVVHINRSVM